MIVVFGSVNVDLVARVPALPRLGETVAGRSLAVLPGGKGANQALAARRAGADVVLVGAVGRDAFADPALALLRDAGVDTARVREVEGPTGTALIHVDDGGDNTIVVIPGANASVDERQVDEALLRAASLVVLQLEVPAGASLALAQRARAASVPVLLNAAPAAPLDPAWLAALDVLVVNAIEAATLAPAFGVPSEPLAFARALAQRHGLRTLVTLGADGAIAATPEGAWRAPALAVDVVDTVGAGDAFVGALAAALDARTPLRRALASATAGGALACTGHGAQAPLACAEAIAQHARWLESRIDDLPDAP